MIGRTEQRLRETTAAIGESVRPRDIPLLRLNQLGASAGQQWRPAGPPWRSGRWLIPVVAATSVATLVTGVSLAAQVLNVRAVPSHRPASAASAANVRPVALPPGTPKFMATSLGGRGSVIATATGRVIAKIPPPAKGYVIEGIGAAPGDRMFVLAGQVFVGGPSPRSVVEFFRVVLGANGKPGHAVRLPGPSVSLHPPITSDGLIAIAVAVSPGGRKYAYAIDRQMLGDSTWVPAVVTVVNSAIGASHTWSLWAAARTAITDLSWAAGGRLSVVGVVGDATVSNGAVVRHRGDELSVVMVLNPSAAGHNLVADSRLVTFGWAKESSTGPSGVLDGPTGGVITSDGQTVVTHLRLDHGTRSELVEMSAATGRIVRVLLDGPRSDRADPVSLDGSSLLFMLSPRHEHPSANYVCAHLAIAGLSTAELTALPFPIYCSTVWPGEPFIAAW